MTKPIAFAGTRGLPANYGGFETAVDEISRRFVDAGYRCDVFCRLSHAKEPLDTHEGRHLIYVPGARRAKLETFAASIQTGWYLLRHRHDYEHVFWFNNANLPGILLSFWAGIPITVNTDGLEWRRRKWKGIFKAYYFLASWLIARFAPRLISDSAAIQKYYQTRFHRQTWMIPYGIPEPVAVSREEQQAILQAYNLESGKYFLQITRFEPDNLPLEIAQSFLKSGIAEQGYRHVIVGFREKTPYACAVKSVAARHNDVQVFPAIYEPKVLFTLRTNCYAYVHGNSVGGTNPALLEAMATCPRVLAIDVEFTRDILLDLGNFYTLETLAEQFKRSLSYPVRRDELRKRVFGFYQWDAVARSYMAIVNERTPDYLAELERVVVPTIDNS